MKKNPKNKHLLKPPCAHPAWIFLIGLYYPPFLPYSHIWKKVIRAEVIEKKKKIALTPPPIFVFKFVLNPPLPQPPMARKWKWTWPPTPQSDPPRP